MPTSRQPDQLMDSVNPPSFRDVRSCGTDTRDSVPCMFSSLGKAAFEKRKSEQENLLDLLQAAGLAVLWIDNQAGCKEVCARVPPALEDIAGGHQVACHMMVPGSGHSRAGTICAGHD